MPAHLRTALSAGVHALVVWLVSVAVAHGIDIPAHWSAWLQTAILAALVAGYTWLTHWLSTRKGDGGWPRAARGVAKLLTLGLGALGPAPRPTPPVVAEMRARHAAAAKARRGTGDLGDALAQAARQAALRNKQRGMA